ncbi:hypothetical protein PAT3040_01485 [Paenibacillus agaridevorans]|uniref:Uncharacterized protein n=1 Tax=Paenibacillus agaridevorans TaxID=171404 RepID=A0A2R5ET43_9BACL|nr:hypothetical protein PAT3040_01485 [Paenibacillus agaridevorans]
MQKKTGGHDFAGSPDIGKHGGTRFGFVNLLPYWEDAKSMIGRDDYLAYLKEYGSGQESRRHISID